MNFKKSLLKVFSANFLQLISSLIIGFIVPIILSIEGYANLKTYTLYISYIGFLHFGFVDGLYIKYGGKKYEEINKEELKGEHNFLFILELIVSLVILFLSIIFKDIILLLLSITILPYMLATFHKNIFQATGKFEKYSKIMYIYSFSYVIFNIFLAIIFKSQNYIYYCLTTFVSNLISILVIEYIFLKDLKNIKSRINVKSCIKDMKVGFIILLGNLSVMALFGIDKWFVKFALTIEDFAYYSFAVSMFNIMNTLVNSVSITFYNYLFSNNTKENINRLKRYLITLGGCASLGYFALSFIVNYFIKKYIPSLNIIAVTFAVFPYMILIKALYVNLYKVNKDEKKYLKVVVGMLIISTIYNAISLVLFNNTISIAFATILTLITWVIYSTHDLKNVTTDKEMYIYMFGLTIFFLICAHIFNWLIGGVVYLIGYLIWTFIINRSVLIEIKDMGMKIIDRRIKSKKV